MESKGVGQDNPAIGIAVWLLYEAGWRIQLASNWDKAGYIW